MPSEVQGIGPAQALTELYALVGKVPLSVDSTIVPVVSVGDLAEQVTWGPSAWGSIYVPAAAGANVVKVELSLPVQTTTQGLRVRIEELWLRPSMQSYITLRASPGLPAPTHTGNKAWADLRMRGLPQLLINSSNNTLPTGLQGPFYLWYGATVLAQIPVDWILGANPDTGVQQGLYIESSALLASLGMVVRFREGAPR